MFAEKKDGKDYTNEKGSLQVGDKQSGYYHPIFGSIGSSVNFQTIKHDGDSVFGTNTVIVISANQTTTDRVTEQLEQAGFSSDMINVMTIPAGTYNIELKKGDDTFCFLGRISQPEDKDAY